MKTGNLKLNLKQTSKQDENEKQPPEEQIMFCYFCNKKAEFKCGLCMQATYCTPQHQKADWPTHKRKCIRPQDKLKQLQRQLQNQKKIFFDKLTKGLKSQCEGICDTILKISEEIVIKFPNPQHEIEYGTAICCYAKMLQSVKSFNVAQQILMNYLKQKDQFLKDTSNIPEKINIENPKFQSTIKFVQGKLKLLSVLCNLMHQAVRNSAYMIEILIHHCQKFYGPDSLQVSNAYFQLGNYYIFINQSMKACACYLVAGKIRKSKGVSSFYNAAIIMIRTYNFVKAIKLLLQCKQMIQKDGDSNSLIDRVFLALAYCYKKLNHFENTVHYLEKSLCQINIKVRFNNQEQKCIRQLLKYLSEQYKKQFNNVQILSLPKERVTPDQQVIISNNNLEDYWDLQAENTKKKKAEQWAKSFKNQVQKTNFQSKIPMTNPLIQKVLFHNHFTDDKNDENLSAATNQAATNAMETINVDLQYMSNLTATQVRFMNELNRLIVINKDKPTLHDIIQNSNFMQEISPEKIERFYQLNPQLLRQKQDYNLIDEQQQKAQPKMGEAKKDSQQEGKQQKSTKNQNLKLDLNKLPKKE